MVDSCSVCQAVCGDLYVTHSGVWYVCMYGLYVSTCIYVSEVSVDQCESYVSE